MLNMKGIIPSPDLDTYSAMIGLRNRLVHGYDDISAEVLYDIVTRQLGDFKKFISAIIPLIQSEI